MFTDHILCATYFVQNTLFNPHKNIIIPILRFFFPREREREREHTCVHVSGGGAERQERERERIPSRLCAVSTEPDARLELTNHETMT